jgi:Transcriptional regulatory protein, C terminal
MVESSRCGGTALRNLSGDKGTIFVVDEEASIRRILQTRLEILQQLWGFVPEMNTDTRVVDVHISRLRTKGESDPNDPELIITARGSGYFFPRIIDSEQE